MDSHALVVMLATAVSMFGMKFVPLKDGAMRWFSVGVALVIAALALAASGQLGHLDWSDPEKLVPVALALWALMKLAFDTLKATPLKPLVV